MNVVVRYLIFSFSTFIHCRLNTSLVSLVAISANPAAEGTTSMLSNGAQRTVAPTIVKPIHNGTAMSLVNVTPAEPSNLSKSVVYVCPSIYTHQIHHTIAPTCTRVHMHASIHPCILSIQYVLLHFRFIQVFLLLDSVAALYYYA